MLISGSSKILSKKFYFGSIPKTGKILSDIFTRDKMMAIKIANLRKCNKFINCINLNMEPIANVIKLLKPINVYIASMD